MEFGFNDGFDDNFDMMGNVIGILSIIVFAIIFGIIIVSIIMSIIKWNRNNHSPQLSVFASLVSKRIDVSDHRHGHAGDPTGAHGHYTSSTTYYVTFQVESGDRMEFCVSGQDYGLLAEGDTGSLTFQGTRFISFKRV